MKLFGDIISLLSMDLVCLIEFWNKQDGSAVCVAICLGSIKLKWHQIEVAPKHNHRATNTANENIDHRSNFV